MVDETVKMISICGFEGMCARVAQWWSIALPRRGSRVRIPSRALKEIEKRVIRWMALFSMFKPCRARTVRMSPRCSGRRSRTSPGRSATSRALNKMRKRGDIRWIPPLFFACSSLVRFERFEVLAPICSSQETSCAIKNYLFFQKKQATSDFCAIMLYYERIRCIKRGE